MGKRPAYTYREHRRPWTRTASTKTDKAYVKGVRDPIIRSFDIGKMDVEDADIRFDLTVDNDVQIRDEALESGRVNANKPLESELGLESYRLKIRTYPHQCLRKHSLASGAGADRVSEGMRKSFGRPSGRAVRAKKNQKIMSVWVREEHSDKARKALKRAGSKLPGSISVKMNKL
ncbi:MAG: 50S ribosomal protein L16 [archaeon]